MMLFRGMQGSIYAQSNYRTEHFYNDGKLYEFIHQIIAHALGKQSGRPDPDWLEIGLNHICRIVTVGRRENRVHPVTTCLLTSPAGGSPVPS